MSNQSHPKSPILPAHLILIPNVININCPKYAAFYSALLVQFFSCIRKSNLLPVSTRDLKSNKHLKRGDIVFTADSMILVLPWTKTLQNKDNLFTIPIARAPPGAINPVETYHQFVLTNPVPSSYPAFAYRDAGVIHILTQSQYIDILKSALEKLNIPSKSFSSHSIRRGGASLLFQMGLSPNLIKHHGTWRSNCYTRYITFNHEQKMLPTQSMLRHFQEQFGHLSGLALR